MVLMELIGDLLPPGTLNIVNGFGVEAGKPLATSHRVAKVAFTGETTTGRLIMQYASQNLIPVTLELGGKSPNIFFSSVMDSDDEYFDKCLEGAALFALNQGEVCTCPSRILVQDDIADKFIDRVIERTKKIKMGNPLDPRFAEHDANDDAAGKSEQPRHQRLSQPGRLCSGFKRRPQRQRGADRVH